ncbi:MAG: hypothetical protein CVU61_06990 [Deltaproteobacteria bacterium HGW-Deltaproteobacteria-19]|jgi:hypothetical protein|nr:MAG: hypothetical protein CVU61_06990 [Deltaproteobacteria bacterium HGW-Deltaproteobacteria-19]
MGLPPSRKLFRGKVFRISDGAGEEKLPECSSGNPRPRPREHLGEGVPEKQGAALKSVPWASGGLVFPYES